MVLVVSHLGKEELQKKHTAAEGPSQHMGWFNGDLMVIYSDLIVTYGVFIYKTGSLMG